MRPAWGIALLLGLIVPLGRLEAQVSPGPLAKAHIALEGTLKCTQCHGTGKDAIPPKCLACHKEVAWLVNRGRGFHGSPPVKGVNCASCHPDHAGVDFQLIKWPDGGSSQFDHRTAGYSLTQSHARLRCEHCHVAKFRVSPAANLTPNRRSTWTGLERTCASCHEDVHRGALGDRCTGCHDIGKWTITPGFNHDTTDYPLTGKHASVTCEKCHADARLSLKRDAKGALIPVYRPVPHQTCTACHQDVHKGAFGANCSACHSTKAFTEISGAKGFDHTRTRFPLKGKHGTVACASCHRDFTTEAGRRPASSTCATCHKVDPHGGTATLAGRSADCGACHGESGFSPGVFALESHRRTGFPLEGKHAAVRCGDCHKQETTSTKWGTAKVAIRPPFATCTGCHVDQHGGQLAAGADKGDCASCHRADGWKPSSIDVPAHAKFTFALEGRHAAIDCRACHGDVRYGLKALPNADRLGKAKFAMTGIETSCGACHLDPHGGTFEPGGRKPVKGGCPACHSASAFFPATVDVTRHQEFSFTLVGAHRAAPCQACHRELEGPAPTKRWPMLLLAGIAPRPSRFDAKTDCVGCHQTQSPHGAQFDARKGGARCDLCHNEEAFAPASRFDHDRDATFKLEGGHRPVACAKCHKSEPVPGQAPRMIFRPLSGRCEECHAKKM